MCSTNANKLIPIKKICVIPGSGVQVEFMKWQLFPPFEFEEKTGSFQNNQFVNLDREHITIILLMKYNLKPSENACLYACE